MGDLKKVLVLVAGYLPGFKSGGPVRTIKNLVDALSGDVSFSVICRDRDLGDGEPYVSVNHRAWNIVDSAEVFYVPPGVFGYIYIYRILRGDQWDVVHVNSFFSFPFGIFPVLVWQLFPVSGKLILGPRGEFSAGALALKSLKKKVYIYLAKRLGLYGKVVWHASTEHEASDVRKIFGDSAAVCVAVDIAVPPRDIGVIDRREAFTPLRVVFISRISKKKNLQYAFRVLKKVQVPVVFDIYGPIEDGEYWSDCLKLAQELPENVTFVYRGVLAGDAVPNVLRLYDLFLFPTLGENFGHVIAEALHAGVPVLVSDATPWRELELKGVGWDYSLKEVERFAQCVNDCFYINPEEFYKMRVHIVEWARVNIGSFDAIRENRKLFGVSDVENG